MPDITLPMELYDSRRVKRARGRASTATRRWLCSWDDRYDYDLLPCEGKSKYTDGISSSDKSSADDRLICVSVDYEGVGAGKTVGMVTLPFDGCLVTAQYADVQQLVLGYQESALDEEWEGTHITVPVGSGRIYEDGTPCDDLVQMLVNMTVWRTKRFFLYTPWMRKSILEKSNTVNRLQYQQYSAETLRFDGARIRKRYDDELGALIMEVHYQFTEFAPGWNKRWVNGRWQRISPPLYNYSNFHELLGAQVWIS